uniref:Uncharacterized protein n=1 Tax=viral metagenome TaxID=1070528 RepID=A0A6M3XR96_9ZZZZ
MSISPNVWTLRHLGLPNFSRLWHGRLWIFGEGGKAGGGRFWDRCLIDWKFRRSPYLRLNNLRLSLGGEG